MLPSVNVSFIGKQNKKHLNNPPTRNSKKHEPRFEKVSHSSSAAFYFVLCFFMKQHSEFKNIQSQRGPFEGLHDVPARQPECLPVLGYFHSFYFSTFIKPHKLNKRTQTQAANVHMETSNPHDDGKWKNIWIIYFLVTQGFALPARVRSVSSVSVQCQTPCRESQADLTSNSLLYFHESITHFFHYEEKLIIYRACVKRNT